MAQSFTKSVPLDTDVTLSGDSNGVVPSQHAVKTYVDTRIRTNAFQRNLANDLSLLDGECLIVLDYINAGAYNITLSGDAHLRILF